RWPVMWGSTPAPGRASANPPNARRRSAEPKDEPAEGCGACLNQNRGRATISLPPARSGSLVVQGERLPTSRGQGSGPGGRTHSIADGPHTAVHHHGLDPAGVARLWVEATALGHGRLHLVFRGGARGVPVVEHVMPIV